MKIRFGEVIQVLMVALFFTAAFMIYPMMPEKMASHWGVDGRVNGWMPASVALFILPGMSVLILFLFILIPRISPAGKDMESFRTAFEVFAVVMQLFMLYVFLLMAAWNMGVRFEMGRVLSPGFAAIIFAIAKMLEKTKPNYFIGIRTAWTMQNEKVWERTHRLGAKLLYAAAVLALLGVFLPPAMVPVILLGPIILISIVLTGYSYNEYKKETGT